MTLSPRRQQLLGATFLMLALTAGCNPLMLPFFMGDLDPKAQPPCKLATDDKHREVRVLILSYCALETRQELLGADRDLCAFLAQKMTESAQANKENLKVISSAKVQRYKDEHPNWQAMGADEIGKYFHADYVIELEVTALGLFQPRTYNQVMRGNAEISVRVHDMRKPGEEPKYTNEYSCEFPKSHEVPISDMSPAKFRLMFLTKVASELSWFFTAHPVADQFSCE
jgi:hypothetical protein